MRAQITIWLSLVAIAGCGMKSQSGAASGSAADGKVVVLSLENFEQEVLASPKPVLVDFYADWCGPCKMMKPVVEDLAQEYGGKVKFGSLNVDDHPEVAGAFQTRSIPTFLLFKNGRAVQQVVGAVPKHILEEVLRASIDDRLAAK